MTSKFLFKKISRFLILIFFTISCSSNKIYLDYKIKSKKYANETVSIQSALNLALQSYIRGCIQQKESTRKDIYIGCVKKAKEFIHNEVIFILDQNGKSI